MLEMCQIRDSRTCKKRVFEWNGCQKSLKPEVPTSTTKYQKIVSKWSQSPGKIGPGTQQKTMLKNRVPKIKKYSKNDSKMAPKKWGDFGGNAYWDAFGGPSRFCDEKVGPQRCQRAPKARKMSQKWHKRAPRVWKWAPKVDPFRSQAKTRSKSGPFGIQARRTARSALNNSSIFPTRMLSEHHVRDMKFEIYIWEAP